MHTYSHAWVLLYAFIYFPWFTYLERHVTDNYFVIHSIFDDYIPFCEYFIIPYLLWFAYIAVTLGYLFFNDKQGFYKASAIMFSGMTICLIIYTLLPNGLQLRPVVEHDNLLAKIASLLYAIDTPTNVCPSIHVSSTVAIMMIVQRYRNFRHPVLIKGITIFTGIAICLSTVVLKQHSVIDVILGLILTLLLYRVCMQTDWLRYMQRIPYKRLLYRNAKDAE